MSPICEDNNNDRKCFPRVSGDEPKADAEALKQFVFSPRERG